MEDSSVKCTVTVEHKGAETQRSVHRSSTVRLVRSASRQLLVAVEPERGPVLRFPLPAVSVHTRFMADGKASFTFSQPQCTLFLANAPPADLTQFLKTVYVKTVNEGTPGKSAVAFLKTKAVDEISPMTNAELEKAKSKVSKATETTPSPSGKRKLSGKDAKGPVAKKLYAPSPLATDVLNEEQKRILDACLRGTNVFFTGSAGTGKSFLLRKIIAALPPDVTMPTASTGVAACHIGVFLFIEYNNLKKILSLNKLNMFHRRYNSSCFFWNRKWRSNC